MNRAEPIRSKDDIELIKEYLLAHSERNYILFLLGINTGLRISDILTLRMKDVTGWYISIREKKTGKEKTIKMTPVLKKALRKYISGKDANEYLIKSREGKNKPLTRQGVNAILDKVAKEFGLGKMSAHSMRKTFGYHYYKKYKDVAMLMDIFNHASPVITLKYIGIRQDQIDLTMARFGL